MDKKLPNLWIEEEDTSSCPCCNIVLYVVRGLDKDGDHYESEMFQSREKAVERLIEMGGSDE